MFMGKAKTLLDADMSANSLLTCPKKLVIFHAYKPLLFADMSANLRSLRELV